MRPALASALLVLLLLAGCGGAPERDSAPPGLPDMAHVPDAVPRVEPYRRANLRSYTVLGRTYHPLPTAAGYRERGIASWYGRKFHGRPTATGERYDMYAMTAAHRILPLPSYVRVTNLENGRSVVVRVNDRGPFHDNRIIDLSYAAASRLGMLRKGTALVEVVAIDPRAPRRSRTPPPARPPVPATAAAPRIYIQAGAFASRANAERFAAQLERRLARRVEIVTGEGAGGTVHRVRIGPLASVEIADRVTGVLRALEIHDSRVLIR